MRYGMKEFLGGLRPGYKILFGVAKKSQNTGELIYIRIYKRRGLYTSDDVTGFKIGLNCQKTLI